MENKTMNTKLNQASDRLLKICKIANQALPVSEDSRLYSIFYQRREIAQKIRESKAPIETEIHLIQMMDKLEDYLKEELFL